MNSKSTQLIKHFVLISLLFKSLTTYALQTDPSKFRRLGVEEGLSHVTVNSILQDRKGFMWFGTTDGLNQYDGFKFKIYKNEPNDLKSIANNVITALHEDDRHYLWVATYGGLHRFDRNTNQFQYIPVECCSETERRAVRINDITPDNQGNIWVASEIGVSIINTSTLELQEIVDLGPIKNPFRLTIDDSNYAWISTANGELFRFDITEKKLEEYGLGNSENVIWDIHQDTSGIIWVGVNGGGLFKYNSSADAFSEVQNSALTNKNVLSIFEDSNNNLWVGTNKGGVSKINAGRTNVTTFINERDNPSSISSNDIRSVFEDREGVIWFGTWGGGLNLFVPPRYPFRTYSATKKAKNGKSLSHNFVHAVVEDGQQNLWVGTKNGLNKIDTKTGEIQSYFENSSHKIITNNYIKSLYQHENGDVWVGTENGLSVFNELTRHRRFFYNDPQVDNSLPANDNTFIFHDSRANLWVGTWGGLGKISLDQKEFDNKDIPEQLKSEAVLAMTEDSRGHLWIGTYYNGVYDYDPLTQSLQQYKSNPNDSNSLGNNRVWTLHTDDNDQVWIGTFGGGLNKVIVNDSQTIFKKYTERDGLSNNALIGILSDKAGNLWISGNKGISKFDPLTERFVSYDSQDGLQGDHFNVAYHNGRSGNMYFGGSLGLTAFVPEEIVESNEQIKVTIDGFELFNQPDHPDIEKILPESILNTRDIVLDHKQEVFSFNFGALYFDRIEHYKYAFRLKGFDVNWRFTDASRRFVTYTSIPSGNYTFEVKARTANGLWGEQSTIELKILPPWWTTWWFRISVALIVVLLIALLYFSRIKIIERQKKQLEKQVIERTSELTVIKNKAIKDKLLIQKQANRLEELDKVKSRFFANISHELRTPLTLINAPLESLIYNGEIKDSKIRDTLKLAQRNGVSLLSLVEEILDLGKLDAGKLTLLKNPLRLKEFLSDIIERYAVGIEKRGITLDFNFWPSSELTLSLDENKTGKIIHNILSNALKFTRSKISISVQYKLDNSDRIEIIISDDGLGIHPDDLPHIFDRYYQSEQPHRKAEGGTGIGLALARELALLQEGSLTVESTLNNGSVFILELPVHEVKVDTVTVQALPMNNDLESSLQDTIATYTSKFQIDKPVLLITEDHPEMRAFVAQTLAPYFKTLQADNGKVALGILNNQPVDIIISDVMMPEMDGFELLKAIKINEKLRQVSLVMLTARADYEDKLQALTLGIDDYLTKPFNSAEFLARIKNILDNRIKIIKELKTMGNADASVKTDGLATFIKCYDLSDREVEVMQLLAKRFSNIEIADSLFVSKNTIKYHIKNLYTKLGVTSRSEVFEALDNSDI